MLDKKTAENKILPDTIRKNTELVAQHVVGMTLQNASATFTDVMFREVSRDGEALGVTMDMRDDRIDVTTQNGVITAVHKVG